MADKQRVQVEPLLASPVSLVPAARRVNEYVAAPAVRHGPTEAEQFANAMARAFEPVDAALQQYIAADQEKQRIKGAKDRMEMTPEEAEEGPKVRGGILAPILSGSYLKGWKEQDGRLRGIQGNVEAQLRMEKLKGSWATMDPDDQAKSLLSFMQVYRQNALHGQEDPDVLKGLMPQVAQTQQQLLAQGSAEINKNLQFQVATNTYSEVVSRIEQAQLARTLHGQPLDNKALSREITGVLQNAYAHGLTGQMATQAAVDAVTEHAMLTDDVSVLDLLDHIKAGSGYIGRTAYGRKKSLAAQDYIYQKEQREWRDSYAHLDRHRKEAATHVMQRAVETLLEDPQADMRPYAKVIAQYDPGAADNIMRMRDVYLNNSNHDNPQVVKQLEIGIHTGAGVSNNTIANAMIEGDVSWQTGMRLFGELKSHSEGKVTLDKAPVNRARSLLRSTLMAPTLTSTLGGHQQQGIITAQAISDFNTEIAWWAKDHPNASEYEMSEFADKLTQKLQRRYAGEMATRAADVDLLQSFQPELRDVQLLRLGRITDRDFDIKYGPGKAEQVRKQNANTQ